MDDRPFRGSAALAAGQVTRGTLNGPRYRRIFLNVYLSTDAPLDLAARSRAAYLWAGGAGVLCGYSAAELYVTRCAPAGAPAEIVVPGSHRRAPSGLITRQDRLAADERRHYADAELTTPLRTAYDLARRLDLVEAVVAADALAGRFGFAPTEILDIAARYPRTRGLGRVAEVARHIEPLAESAMETRLRMLLVLAGLPRPVAQHGFPDRRARIVAWVDLAYPERHIAIEYDGAHHFTPQRSMADVHRITRLTDLGWRVYRYRSTDVYNQPWRIIGDIRRALGLRAAA